MIALLRCIFAHPHKHFHRARDIQQAYAAMGVHSVLESCSICGNWHLRSRG